MLLGFTDLLIPIAGAGMYIYIYDRLDGNTGMLYEMLDGKTDMLYDLLNGKPDMLNYMLNGKPICYMIC